MHHKFISKFKLHSIPIKTLRYVSYSIPLMCSLALLLLSCGMVNIDERVYALDNSGEDSSLQFASGTLVSATLSIDGESGASLSEQVLAAPGEVAYSKEHTVTVTANNIESYDLIISGSNTLSSSGTQIT